MFLSASIADHLAEHPLSDVNVHREKGCLSVSSNLPPHLPNAALSFVQAMDSHQLIDAQFDRAVEIIQSLPKNGPIQTDYEEKLTIYRYATPYSYSSNF